MILIACKLHLILIGKNMKLIKLQYCINLEKIQIEKYKKRIETHSNNIKNLEKIKEMYPESEEIKDYQYSRFKKYKFFKDKNITDTGNDMIYRYSKYSGIRIVVGHKIFDKNFMVCSPIIEIRGSPYLSDEECEININYEKMFDTKIVIKIDKLIIKNITCKKIKIPKKNLSSRLKKLLSFS